MNQESIAYKHFEGFMKAAMQNGVPLYQATGLYKQAFNPASFVGGESGALMRAGENMLPAVAKRGVPSVIDVEATTQAPGFMDKMKNFFTPGRAAAAGIGVGGAAGAGTMAALNQPQPPPPQTWSGLDERTKAMLLGGGAGIGALGIGAGAGLHAMTSPKEEEKHGGPGIPQIA